MITLRNAFKTKVGYSDHTLGMEVSIAAVALGAEIIEKHLTLDKNMHGPDHTSSLNKEEFKNMVAMIRNVEKALGSGLKIPNKSELKIKEVVNKVLVAKTNILTGEILSSENMTCKRAGVGLSPQLWDEIVGRHAIKNFKKDEAIEI
jgi:N,N'-diacetyllegionaminate synthase